MINLYRRHLLPRLLDRALAAPQFALQRQRVLADVQGEVLEIGFGTGLNLAHYPARIRSITTVDPNSGMNTLAQRRIAASPITVDQHTLSSERLPFPDGSFDSVVSTWTLCSIADIDQALCEVRRVLRPGGALHFVEHGLSNDPAVQRWQHRLTPIQRIVADGCHLDRPIDALIAAQGLEISQLDRFDLPDMPRTTSYHYRGVAHKPR